MNRRTVIFAGLGAAAITTGLGGLVLGAMAPVSPAPEAPAAPVWIVGDSIGEGLRWASGEQGSTKRGIAIGGFYVFHQLSVAPPGAHLVISLGTNDAIAGHGLDADAFAKTVALIKYKVPASWTWVGPPRPNKPWAHQALAIDQALALAVPKAGGRYVSAFATPGLYQHHAKDGVHFDLDGYRLLWAAAKP